MARKLNKDNREGTIYYDKTAQKFIGEFRWKDNNGKYNRKKFSSKDKNTVIEKMEAFKKELKISNGRLNSGEITFEDFSESLMKTVFKERLKPSALLRKRQSLEYQVYPFIGYIPINEVSVHDVQSMINDLSKTELSYSTIKKAYGAVNSVMKVYRVRTQTALNPCEGVLLPKKKEKEISDIKYFKDEEIKLIENEATRKYSNGRDVYRLGYSIILLMYTGMRVGEMLALTWDDIDFENKTITVNKNAVAATEDGERKMTIQDSTKTKKSTRIIPMTSKAMEALRYIKNITGDNDYVISSKNNKLIHPENINRMFHSILVNVGIMKPKAERREDDISYGVHTLRHTFASLLFKNNCEIKVISEILGHADTKITENIYIHLSQEQKKKAIENIDGFIK